MSGRAPASKPVAGVQPWGGGPRMHKWNRAFAAALALAALAWTPAAQAGGGWHGGHGHGHGGHGHHGGTSVVIGVSPSFGWGGPFWYGAPYAYYPYAYAYP